jgi:hypothetical protein
VAFLNISETHKFREGSQNQGSRFPQFYIRKISKTFFPHPVVQVEKNSGIGKKSVFGSLEYILSYETPLKMEEFPY